MHLLVVSLGGIDCPTSQSALEFLFFFFFFFFFFLASFVLLCFFFVQCKSCGALLSLGVQACKACGASGLFTPGPIRKPVTPYSVRKEGFVRRSGDKKMSEAKLDFRKLKGTLLAAAASDATRMALQPRHRVNWADVQLSTQIGEGAYANVYEGTWQNMVVAVKEMKLQEASETQVNDFLTEVTVLASLSHPNVIDFIGACTDPAHLAILLEFMPGGDASILLARDDVQITWERRLSWLLDVARAMQYLHSCSPQIIHRDLKTENVLISADFLTAKVTDFGLSQAKAAAFVASYDISSTGGMTPRPPQISVSSPPMSTAGGSSPSPSPSPSSVHLLGSAQRLLVKVKRSVICCLFCFFSRKKKLSCCALDGNQQSFDFHASKGD